MIITSSALEVPLSSMEAHLSSAEQHILFSPNICSIISFICSGVRAFANSPTDPTSKGDEVDACSEPPMDDESLVDESTEESIENELSLRSRICRMK
jgi:hypothetical protein